MFRNYLTVAIRNLFRNKMYSLINILGLGVAIACCVVAYVNYRFSASFDNFHPGAKQIYLVNSFKIQDGQRENWTLAPLPMAEAIRKDIPGIERISRYSVTGGIMKYEDKVFNESFYFADSDFLEMFNFPRLAGSVDALSEVSAVVISREIARKYFGTADPLGKQIAISSDGEQYYDFMVQAVLEDFPMNSSIQADIILPLQNMEALRQFEVNSWEFWSRATLIQVSEAARIREIEQQLQQYVAVANAANENWQINGFYLLPFLELANQSRDLRGEPFMNTMPPVSIIAPSITALLVLVLACFNFVNTAIAFSARRLKEIGVRKVLGGLRRQLIVQFIGENLILSAISLLAGIGLSYIFVPYYDSLWPAVSLSINFSENPALLLFLGGLLFITGIAAGAYPALYVSRFKPVHIFQGRQKLGGTNPLIRVLLTFQFALSMAAIIGGIIMQENADYIDNFDLGFDKTQVIAVQIRNAQEYELMKNAIENHPDILQVAGSRSLVGLSWSNQRVEIDQKTAEVVTFDIGEDYFAVQGFTLAAGRSFDRELESDREAVLINETLARTYGWESPLDQAIIDRANEAAVTYHVIGVVKDFHYNGLWRRVQPAMMRFAGAADYRYLTVKFRSEDLKAISGYLESEWKQLFPALPYSGVFIDELQAEALMVNDSIRRIFRYIAIIAILISGMGLYALVSLNIARRSKEIGIRKVLGASVLHIGRLISREFILLLTVATAISAALAYFGFDAMLKGIWAYHVDFGMLPFLAGALLVVLAAVLTVGMQVYRVASSNPVEAIREE